MCLPYLTAMAPILVVVALLSESDTMHHLGTIIGCSLCLITSILPIVSFSLHLLSINPVSGIFAVIVFNKAISLTYCLTITYNIYYSNVVLSTCHG